MTTLFKIQACPISISQIKWPILPVHTVKCSITPSKKKIVLKKVENKRIFQYKKKSVLL